MNSGLKNVIVLGDIDNDFEIFKSSSSMDLILWDEEQCVPIAFIVADENCGKNNEEIEKYIHEECYKNLEETSVPYGYVFVDILPVNIGGKVDVRKIKKVSGIDLMKENVIPRKLFFHNN